MIWVFIVLLILILLMGWLLVSPLVMVVDTRVPMAAVSWMGIGKASIWFEGEWWLNMQLPFYRKTIRMVELRRKPKKIKKEEDQDAPIRKMKMDRILRKVIKVARSFQVQEWQLAVDTGDFVRNGQLYLFNYLPGGVGHLRINFLDQNYLVLKMKNRAWRIVYAFLK